MRRLTIALCVTVGILSGCDNSSRVTDGDSPEQSPGSFKIAVPIPKLAKEGVARVECVIAGTDMTTMQVEMSVGSDDVVRGTVDGVRPGTGRTVTLNAYDSGGELTYSGSATADVVAGETASVSVVLRASLLEGGTTVDLPGGASMEFVWVEPGTFTMGSPEAEEGRRYNEGPQHQVTISKGFYLGKYELTQRQWESVVGTSPWQGQPSVQTNPDGPASYISWDNVQELLNALNSAAGSGLYRLPTEAEWEYSCRAGTTTPWSFGSNESDIGDYAWYSGNASGVGESYPHAVGQKLPNPWGLYDMHGNVLEWAQDWYGDYAGGAQFDPTGPAEGTTRVIRGGNVWHDPGDLRSARHSGTSPTSQSSQIGVRLLRME